ncbi:MAG: uracil-DNA glycosylase [Candidatus Eisenbacteria bacterium]
MTRPDEAALARLESRIIRCRKCPRLVEWREQVARVKRRAFLAEEYWGRPVPAFGAASARLVVVGLAPAAHGGNRSGRMFTGDRSGDWLYAALHAQGFANQAESRRRGDGLALRDAFITAGARCAPPDNKPTREEFSNCRPWFVDELALLARMRVVVALGGLAWGEFLLAWRAQGGSVPSPRPRFAHGAGVALERDSGDAITLLGSYHPSQQNTSTGRLTRPMLEGVFARARGLLGAAPAGG